MIEAFVARFHQRILQHDQTESHVSVPLFDPTARGILIRCSCGKRWAW